MLGVYMHGMEVRSVSISVEPSNHFSIVVDEPVSMWVFQDRCLGRWPQVQVHVTANRKISRANPERVSAA